VISSFDNRIHVKHTREYILRYVQKRSLSLPHAHHIYYSCIYISLSRSFSFRERIIIVSSFSWWFLMRTYRAWFPLLSYLFICFNPNDAGNTRARTHANPHIIYTYIRTHEGECNLRAKLTLWTGRIACNLRKREINICARIHARMYSHTYRYIHTHTHTRPRITRD